MADRNNQWYNEPEEPRRKKPAAGRNNARRAAKPSVPKSDPGRKGPVPAQHAGSRVPARTMRTKPGQTYRVQPTQPAKQVPQTMQMPQGRSVHPATKQQAGSQPVKPQPAKTQAPKPQQAKQKPVKQKPVKQKPVKQKPVKQKPADYTPAEPVDLQSDNIMTNLPYPADYKNDELKAQREKEAKEAEIAKINQKIAAKEEKKRQKAERRALKKKKSLDSHAKAERNAIRNGIFGAIAVSAALLVLAFVVYHLVSYVAEKPQSSFVTDGAIEHTIGARAMIIRDETPIMSDVAGELVTSVTEGSRIANAQNLAMVVPEDKQSMVNDLRNVQSQISEVQQELIEQGNVGEAKKVYDSYNENIDPIIDLIRNDSATGKLQSLSTYTSSLTVLLDEREAALAEISFNDERLKMLRSDEDKYQSALKNNSSMIKAPKPGIVSFRLDGKEEQLTFDQVASAGKADVRKLINSSVGAIQANYHVQANTGVCRIVQNEKQQLAVYLSGRDAIAANFATGTRHDINISAEGIVIQGAEVVRCDSGEDGMLIVFETTRYVEDLLDLRSVDIEIVITRSSGLRLSMTNLVNEDLLPSDRSGFAVFFEQATGVLPENFTIGNTFNLNIIPNAIEGENGETQTPESVVLPGCEVMHVEADADGNVLVGFATVNDYSRLLTINSKFTEGYQAVFIDSVTGLGANIDNISPVDYKGIASIYVNNQGFVAEHRVILTDYDREFAIVTPVPGSKIPDNNTVIIINPKSCKPNDKVV